MPVTQAELDIVTKHLGARMPTCPICAAKTWMIDLIVYENEYSQSALPPWMPSHYPTQAPPSSVPAKVMRSQLQNQNVMPLVALMCSECFYVIHFAWLPMVNKVLYGR